MLVSNSNDLASKYAEFIIKGCSSGVYEEVVVDPEKLTNLMKEYMSNPDYIFIARWEENKLVGLLIGHLSWASPLFNTDMIAFEVFWYVDPKYRGIGQSMLQDYEDWALEAGATYVCVAAMNNEVLGPLDRLYTRRGYTKTEVSYMKKVE